MCLQRVSDYIAELECMMFCTFGERSSSGVQTLEDDVPMRLLPDLVLRCDTPSQHVFEDKDDGQ